MEFGKWHDTADFCPQQLVMDLLRGSNWEIGVMDFVASKTDLLVSTGIGHEQMLHT